MVAQTVTTQYSEPVSHGILVTITSRGSMFCPPGRGIAVAKTDLKFFSSYCPYIPFFLLQHLRYLFYELCQLTDLILPYYESSSFGAAFSQFFWCCSFQQMRSRRHKFCSYSLP